ncbi:unnamed protein product [Brassicogethes aeneus]|uniref:Uncharacterized protein n=1 Tax=Brassicogethes aeneus TaxID=1431903 RepID=A0A9P0BAQ7_BRAAE|nr:unnamed protein product [Brassicogethes aeneus]
MNPENKKILIDKLKREKEAAFEKNQAEKIEKKHNQAKQRKKRQCENNSPKEDVLISFKDLTKQGRRHDSSVNTSGLKIISLMNQVPSDSNNYKTQSETICKPQIDGVTTKNPVASTSRSNLNQTSKVNETKKKCKKSSGLTSSERSRKCRQNMSEEKKSLLRERDKERKRKLLAEGKILKIKDLPKKKQVAQRDFWKKTKRNYRARIKTLKAIVSETPPESESEDVLGLVNIEHNLPNDRADVEEIVKTDNRENPNIIDDREIPSKNILRKSSSAKKRSNRNLKKLYREIQTLKTRVHCQKKEIKHIQKEKEKYKKRWLREKEKVKPKEMPNRSDSLDNSTILNSDLSPNTKVERMLKGRHVPKDVKRELVFGEAFRKQIQINFQSNELNLMMHQLNYLRNCIENLQENEVVMQIDFSENYVSKLSSEIQSMHFGANKKQISIHTGVAYIINNGNTETFSFATLSDNLDHQAHAIWRHMTPVLRHLKTKLSKNIMHVKIFSDGPTSQYRNRFNMYLAAKNLNTFFLDAKIEWNFSAPGHGKGPMDGIGGTIKRLADRKILHGSDISSAQEFADIVKRSTKIGIFVIDKDVIQAAKEEIPKLLCKFNKIGQAYQIAWNVDGAYAKYDTRSLSCKFCTPGSVCTHFSVGTSCMKLYHNGIVHEKVKDLITVKFLAKKGKNFIWPTKHDIQSLPCKDILCVLKSPPKSVSKSRPDLFFIPDEEEINVLFETQV